MQADLNGKKVWLNLNHLYYFYVIANEGSMNKASEVLLIGPPSISSQIRQLESNLGHELFDRKNKRLKLTAKGQVVYEYAQSIFRTGQQLIDALNVSQDSGKSSLRIGIPDSIPRSLVLEWFKRFMHEDASLINIKAGKTSDLLNDLKSKSLDLVFTNHRPTADASSFYAKKISSSPLIICGSARFKNHFPTFPQSLDRAPMMLPLPGTMLRNNIDNYFKMQNIKPSVIGETKDVSMQRIIATEGLAMIVAPLVNVQDLISSGELMEIGRPQNLTEDLYLLSSLKWVENPMSQKIMSDIYREA